MPTGGIDFVNRAAIRTLDLPTDVASQAALTETVPEFAHLFHRLQDTTGSAVQEEVRLTRRGKLESLLVRMSERRSETGRRGLCRGL